MEEIKTYFFDTYAFFEIINGNPDYIKFSKNVAIITTKLNLFELHYGLLLLYGKAIADSYFDKLSDFCIDVNDESIKSASHFKALMKKRRLSYIDCLGYMISKSRNIKFLTGDKQFEDLDNVEFVK